MSEENPNLKGLFFFGPGPRAPPNPFDSNDLRQPSAPLLYVLDKRPNLWYNKEIDKTALT